MFSSKLTYSIQRPKNMADKTNTNQQLSLIFRSLVQFFAITFGSSLFNVILGFAKLSKTLRLQFSTKQLLCFLCIITTQYLEWIYIIVLILNNQYIYLVCATLYTGPDWDKFTTFFKHHYQLDFTVATLVLMPVSFIFIYIWRIIYCLISCVRKVGTWKTVLFLKHSPSAFWISILTNLAIYDMNLDNIEDANCLNLDNQHLVPVEQTKKAQVRRRSLDIVNTKPNIKIQRRHSLPNMHFHSSTDGALHQKVSSYSIVSSTSSGNLKTPDSPLLNIKKSNHLFSLWVFSLLVVWILSMSLDSSRDDIFVTQIVFRLMIAFINILCYLYMIR